MHILVTNDDGPPSQQSSPYVHSLVKALQNAGHVTSVILPHVQRSWIGKAHFVGQVVKPTYFRPGSLHQDDGTTHERPLPDDASAEEWILIEGTPATCTQLGLYHFFQDRGPVDLVISGPNYGRNSTALFSLSSGTIGGAMEAATHRKKAIALSYAFYSRNHDPAIIAGASRLSVKLVEHLYANWGEDVDLYSINVPLIEGVENNKVMYTHILQNYWFSGSSFQETEVEGEDTKPEEQEQMIREQKESSDAVTDSAVTSTRKPVSFKWAPTFTDVYKSVEGSPAGNDGWALSQGYTSVTPLKTNFMHATGSLNGELKLSSILTEPPNPHQSHIYAHIAYEDPYVQPLILSALKSQFSASSYTFVDSLSSLPQPSSPLLLILPYESFPLSQIQNHPTTTLSNAYIIRKALIRKHYLASTIHTYITKNPECVLRAHVPLTLPFELDYAEFLDEALVEAWELHESFAKREREWWILKPSLSDRGQGIRLFSTEEQLRAIFEDWEAENPEQDEDQEDNPAEEEARERTGIMTSQLRHFVVQRYIPPLLFPELESRKFHIRTYVLAYGALKVYVYREMLALFAAEAYVEPCTDDEGSGDMRGHLTNTCLQDGTMEGSVLRFWDLPAALPRSVQEDATADARDWRSVAFRSICDCTSALFRAAAAQPTNFQPLPNAFEVFGVDWMVDVDGKVWLLEVNAFPDFRQSGSEGEEVVEGLWNGVLGVVGGFWSDGKSLGTEDPDGMVRVLDLDMGR